MSYLELYRIALLVLYLIQKQECACLIALLLASEINDISSNFNERLDRCDDNAVLAHLFIAFLKMIFVCNETELRIKHGSSFSGTFNTLHYQLITWLHFIFHTLILHLK